MKRNLIANFLGQAWTALMGLVFIPFYIKYLGIEAYGLIGLYAVLQTWLALLDMGITPTLGREMARFRGGGHSNESIRDLLRSIEFLAMFVAIAVALGVSQGADWLARSWVNVGTLSTSVVAEVFVIMGAVIALRFIEGVYRSALVGLQRQVLLNLVAACMATLRWLGAVGIVAFISPSIQAFFIWQALVSIASIAMLCGATYQSLPMAIRSAVFSISSLSSVWQFAAGMMGISILSLLLAQVDKVLLAKLLTLPNYGYYTLAAAAAGALYMLISPITQAMFPRLSQLHAVNDEPAVVATYHLGAQLSSVLLGSAALVLVVFASELLQLWTQDAELVRQTAPLLRMLALGNLVNGLMWMPYQTQLAYGRTKLTVQMNLIAVLFFVPAILWTVPRFGAIGAAWLWIVLNSISMLVVIYYMHKNILCGERLRWYLQDTLMPVIGAAVTVILCRWAVPMPTGMLSKTLWLGIVVLLTLSTAAASANLVRQSLLKSIIALCRSSRLKK